MMVSSMHVKMRFERTMEFTKYQRDANKQWHVTITLFKMIELHGCRLSVTQSSLLIQSVDAAAQMKMGAILKMNFASKSQPVHQFQNAII